MNQILGTIRTFRTANFRVIVDALEDYDADLSWDDTGEVLAKLQSGEFICFTVRARVIHDELGEVASDYLGGCIYSSIDEFQDHRECGAQTRKLRAEGSDAICGSYFADMIGEVCRAARKRLATMRTGLNGLTIREVL
jgi:hypothetical protein